MPREKKMYKPKISKRKFEAVERLLREIINDREQQLQNRLHAAQQLTRLHGIEINPPEPIVCQ